MYSFSKYGESHSVQGILLNLKITANYIAEVPKFLELQVDILKNIYFIDIETMVHSSLLKPLCQSLNLNYPCL